MAIGITLFNHNNWYLYFSECPKGRRYTERCVMALSRKAWKLDLVWIQFLIVVHRYTTYGIASF